MVALLFFIFRHFVVFFVCVADDMDTFLFKRRHEYEKRNEWKV